MRVPENSKIISSMTGANTTFLRHLMMMTQVNFVSKFSVVCEHCVIQIPEIISFKVLILCQSAL